MLFLLQVLMLFTSGGAFAAVWWKKRIELTLAVGTCAMMLLLFLFGCAGFLAAGWTAVYILSWLLWGGALAGIIFRRHGARTFAANFLTPGLLFFVLFCAAMLIPVRTFVLSHVDEFSHWGRISRFLYENDVFPQLVTGRSTVIWFPNYPPGAAILEYVILKLHGTLSEWCMKYAVIVFTGTLLTVGYGRSRWKDWGRNLLFGFAAVAVPLIIDNNHYLALMVDNILGLQFGYIAVLMYLTYRNPWSCGIMLALTLPFLFLLKMSGFGLAVILMAVPVGLSLAVLIGVIRGRRPPRSLTAMIAYNLPWLTLIGSKLIWSSVLAVKNQTGAFSGKRISLETLYDAWVYETPRKVVGIGEHWVSAMFCEPSVLLGWVSFPPATWALLCFFLLLSVGFLWPAGDGNRRMIFGLAATLLIGYILFSATMLAYYWFEFSVAEAEMLAGFSRYMGCYHLALLFTVCSIGFIVSCERESAAARWAGILACAFPLVCCGVYYKGLHRTFSTYPNASSSMREPYEIATQIIAPSLGDGKNFAFVCQGGGGVENTVNSYYWKRNFNPPHNLTVQRGISAEKLAAMYAGLDYLYIYKADDFFKSAYGSLFDGGAAAIADNRLYAAASDGKLHPLPPPEAFVLDFERTNLLRRKNISKASWKLSADLSRGDRSLEVNMLPGGMISFAVAPEVPLAGMVLDKVECRIWSDNPELVFAINANGKPSAGTFEPAGDWAKVELSSADAGKLESFEISLSLPKTAAAPAQVFIDDLTLYRHENR